MENGALGAIDTGKAIEKLTILSKHGNSIISEATKRELKII